jgi:hypothetical protein
MLIITLLRADPQRDPRPAPTGFTRSGKMGSAQGAPGSSKASLNGDRRYLFLKLVRRFRTFRSIDFLTILLDGWRGRAFTPGRGKNGAVLHALLARSITSGIAGMVARANRRRLVRTRLSWLAGALGQYRRGAEDACGCEDDCNVYRMHKLSL